MGFFNEYPYTDFHEINLDWILKQIMKLHKDWNEFTALNTITFQGEWDITNQYPAWSVVQYNNAGFVSVQPVPAGITLTNQDYWKSIVDYTVVIADLQSRVLTLETEVSRIQQKVDPSNRKIICITDSYGNYPVYDGRNFQYVAALRAGLSPDNVYDFFRGSAGFSQTGSLNFLAVLQDNESVIDDRTAIDDIYVFGGANDQNGNNIVSGISAFCAYCKSNYPNARVHIGYVTKSWETAYYQYTYDAFNAYSACADYGAEYLTGSENIMHTYDSFLSDKVHPSVTGRIWLYIMTAQLIMSGSCDVQHEIDINITSNDATITLDSTYNKMRMHYNNGVITSVTPDSDLLFLMNFTSPISVGVASSLNNKIELSNSFVPLSPGFRNKHFSGSFVARDTSNVDHTGHYVAVFSDAYFDDQPALRFIWYPSEALSNIKSIYLTGMTAYNAI